jgi:hypothetical protein
MEKFSPLPCGLHMGDYFGYKGFIFFFSVLLIENAIRFILESDASEDVVTVETEIGIIGISRTIDKGTEG